MALHNQVFQIWANCSPKSSISTLSLVRMVYSPSNALPTYTSSANMYMNKCTGLNCPDSPSIPKTPTKCQSGLVKGSVLSRYIQKLADTYNNSSFKASFSQSLSYKCLYNYSRLLLYTLVRLNPCFSSNIASSS